jgi:tRNA(Ile)-lysidine synthase
LSDAAKITEHLKSVMTLLPAGDVGVAVSGGGDSVALLLLLNGWGKANGRRIYAATVNHNLRAEAKAEAEFVANLCSDLNIEHQILSWKDWDGHGNLQNAARNARKSLLTSWAKDLELSAVTLGHTQDDQAETFLMRLARGSGVDGLSGMQVMRGSDPVWVRPLLGVSREELRTYLTGRGQGWINDPTNDDDKFARIKMRKAMPILAELGLTSQRLALTAVGLQPVRAILENETRKAAEQCCVPSELGTVAIDFSNLQIYPTDIQFRILSHAMKWVSGAEYRPRFSSLKSAYDLLMQGKSQTLAGCYLKSLPTKQVIVMRELSNMAPSKLKNGCYDGRWRVSADVKQECVSIQPLGEVGLGQVKNWRELNVLRDILLQTPSAWTDETLISAPLAGFIGSVRISLKIDAEQFYSDIVSH